MALKSVGAVWKIPGKKWRKQQQRDSKWAYECFSSDGMQCIFKDAVFTMALLNPFTPSFSQFSNEHALSLNNITRWIPIYDGKGKSNMLFEYYRK